MAAYLGLAALIALCAVAAAVRGGRREWIGVAIVTATSAALLAPSERGGAGVWALLALDVALVLLLGRMIWKAPRIWPLWVMTALGVGAAASLAFAFQPDVAADTYRRALLLTRYAAALALLIGASARSPHS